MTGDRRKRFWLISMVVATATVCALVSGSTALSSTASGKGQAADDGTLTYGVVGNTNDKIWPYVPASSSSASFMRYQLYDTLTGYAHSGKFVMLLASKFVSTNGFRDWDVHLKKGVKFSNGSTMTSKDVVFSIQSMFSKQHPANQPSILTMVDPKKVTAKSTYVVHFRLKRPFAPFPQVLGTPDFAIISHESTYEKPYGTGPFTLVSFTPARQATLTRNDNYWGQKPKFKTLNVTFFNTDDAVLNALLSGQIDDTTIIGPNLPQVKAAGKSIIKSEGGLYPMIEVRVDLKPLSDVRVRRALQLIIDRKKVIRNGYLGLATLGNDYMGGGDACGPPNVPQLKQNLPKAKQLLAQAGYPDLKVTIHTDGAFPGMMQTAQILAQDASKIGVEVKVQQLPVGAFLNKWGEWPMYLNVNDPPFLVGVFNHYATGAVNNAQNYSSPKMDALLRKLERTGGAAQQCKVIRSIHKLVHDDAISIIPAMGEGLSAFDPKVKGLKADAFMGRTSYMFGGVSVSE